MPEQCPECGRFLKNDLVASLSETDAPCPKCGTALTAAMFGVVAAGPAGTAHGTAGADVLAGWDEGEEPAATLRSSAGPTAVIALEPDEALLAGIGGGILGALVMRGRPGLGALLGAVAGMLAGGLIRRARPRR